MDRDHEKFNCGEKHEIEYVAGKYGNHKEKVKEFLMEKCRNKEIHNSTHQEVYALIERELGITKQ